MIKMLAEANLLNYKYNKTLFALDEIDEIE